MNAVQKPSTRTEESIARSRAEHIKHLLETGAVKNWNREDAIKTGAKILSGKMCSLIDLLAVKKGHGIMCSLTGEAPETEGAQSSCGTACDEVRRWTQRDRKIAQNHSNRV